MQATVSALPRRRIYRNLVIIYALNVLDLLMTLFLQNTGRFKEANPVMAVFISDTLGAMAAKIIVPALLCVYLAVRMNGASPEQLEKSHSGIVWLMIFYIGVNMLHLVWCGVHIMTL